MPPLPLPGALIIQPPEGDLWLVIESHPGGIHAQRLVDDAFGFFALTSDNWRPWSGLEEMLGLLD